MPQPGEALKPALRNPAVNRVLAYLQDLGGLKF
jgi:hypothetical protein